MEAELELKLKLLEIAALEQIYGGDGSISNPDRMFEKAMIFYAKAKEKRFMQWEDLVGNPTQKKADTSEAKKAVKAEAKKKKKAVSPEVKKADKAEAKKEKKAEKTTSLNGMKTCPACDEQVPIGFKQHKYKSDGSKCGHQF